MLLLAPATPCCSRPWPPWAARARPTRATRLTYDEAIDITSSPDPISADTQTGGRTYRIVRGNNQPDDILPYDWHSVFSAAIKLNGNATDDDLDIDFPVRVVATTLTIKQAIGRHHHAAERQRDREVRVRDAQRQRQPDSPAPTRPITLTFEVWYDLPSLRKEAVVQVAASFVDNDGTTFQKTVDLRVAP